MPTDDQPLQPHLLAHGLKTMVVAEGLPRRAFVAHLALDEGDFTMRVAPPQPGPQIMRLSVEPGATSRTDVTIRTSAGVAMWVRQGVLSYDEAHEQGLLDIEGSGRAVETARAMFGFG
jgi:hypothetical protein